MNILDLSTATTSRSSFDDDDESLLSDERSHHQSHHSHHQPQQPISHQQKHRNTATAHHYHHRIASPSSSSSDNLELEILFLDTFSSNVDPTLEYLPEDSIRKEPNVGLVQFTCPVVIHEIRVVPLSTFVSADGLRGIRLGATIPSSFDIHFYVNDLKAKESSTFLDIGCFSYKEYENVLFRPAVSVATDGLFIRGHFESVTLAVVGQITDLKTLVNREQTTELSNDIKDINEDDDNEVEELDEDEAVLEIKEPDETQEYMDDEDDDDDRGHPESSKNITTDESVLIPDVHSLSPSPENPATVRHHQERQQPILSPSPSQHRVYGGVSTPTKSRHSDSSSRERNLSGRTKSGSIRNYKYSSSRSASPSSRRHHRHHDHDDSSRHSKSRSSYIGLSSTKGSSPSSHHHRTSSGHRDHRDDDRHRRSRSRDRRLELNSSHHYRDRDRYDYDYHRHRSSGTEHYGNHHDDRSRSKESSDYHYHHSSTSNHHQHRYEMSSRKRRRSNSPSAGSVSEKNHHHDSRRSVHSRDSSDNRSIRSLTRNSERSGAGGSASGHHHDNHSDKSSRDLSSPKSSSKHQRYTGVGLRPSSIRSPSLRKMEYHPRRRDSREKSTTRDDHRESPDRKRSRYHNMMNIASPGGFSPKSNLPVDDHFTSPASPAVCDKEIVESIASPVSTNDDGRESLVVAPPTLSPLPGSHSSISGSLEDGDSDRQFGDQKSADEMTKQEGVVNDDEQTRDSTLKRDAAKDKLERDEEESSPPTKDATIEFFEPLSPGSDSDDLLQNGNEDDNFEQISTSSDVDIMENNNSLAAAEEDSVPYREEEKDNSQEGQRPEEKAELEVISSDEEYTDGLDAAMASDKVEYAKNYLENVGDKYDDDELDNAFDLHKNLFDPFRTNHLQPLRFPFNSNRTTTCIDFKLFGSILKFVDENFRSVYSIKHHEMPSEERHQSIQEKWVTNVEKLATEIMHLTCPIYYAFNEDRVEEDETFRSSEEDFDQLIRILIMITKDGLDYRLALAQQQIPFKVRHLKAGIKLLIALFSSFDIRRRMDSAEGDEELSSSTKLFQGLLDEDLPRHLLMLYEKPFMTISLRLLILNGLIVVCDHPDGVEYLCGKTFDWTDLNGESEDSPEAGTTVLEELNYQATCYQYILALVIGCKNTRLISVFEELLDKIHLFELFQALRASMMVCNSSDEDGQEDKFIDSGIIHAILSQMVAIFERISNRIHRPLRLVPNICRYEIKTAVHGSAPLLMLSSSDVGLDQVPNQNQYYYIHHRFHCKHVACSSARIGFFAQKAFYRFFQHFDLFSILAKLLRRIQQSLDEEFDHGSDQRDYVCDKLIRMLDLITSHQQGLKFLLQDKRNVNHANLIHEILIGFRSFTHGKNPELIVSKMINFSVQFIARLYTFNLVDKVLASIYNYQKEIVSKKVLATGAMSQLVVPSKNPEVIDSLLRLFMMIHLEKAMFRDSTVRILTMEHNFDSIYSFIIPITSQFDHRNLFVNERNSHLDSTCFIYATKIAIACLQYLPETNLLHFCETYGKSLLKNIENVQAFVQNSNVKLHRSDIFQSHVLKYSSLINWILPLKNGNFNSHDELVVRKYVTILKKHHDSFQQKFSTIENYIDRVFIVEPELVTAIKILVALCDPKANVGKNQDPDLQLKYQYALISCYYLDCSSYLLTLFDAITETCQRPSHQTFANTFNDSYLNLYVKNRQKQQQSGSHIQSQANQTPLKSNSLQQMSLSILHQGSLVLEFLRPGVCILKLILNYLLTSFGHRFNDSTPIPTLLKLYHMMNHYLSTANPKRFPMIELSTRTHAKMIQQQIIEIILSVYTAVYVEHSESEESLRKSVWTKMLKHVFEFILLSPKYFVSGLEILSKILPTPLPLMVNKPLSDSESLFLLNYRKLWSAHLHCINGDIETMINYLVLSNSLQVQKLLRLVCHKMCDLYSATVITISKTVTEFLVHTIGDVLESKSAEATDRTRTLESRYHCNNCLKIIDFILDLFSSSFSFRIGILNAFHCFAYSSAAPEQSKVHWFFLRMFDSLNQKKFEQDWSTTTRDLLLNTVHSGRPEMKDEESNLTRDLLVLLDNYFAESGDQMAATLKAFKFSDNLTSKFVVACSQSLNQYFIDRKIYISNDHNPDVDGTVEEDMASTNQENIKVKQETEDETAIETSVATDNVVSIYSHQLSQLSAAAAKIPTVWPSLAERTPNDFDLKKINLVEISKKYLNLDGESLLKILSNYYLPVVELPEAPEKPAEDMNKMNLMNLPTKRSSLRGRGRLYGHRSDLFRSRPPNTSRPPSMHVDDFLALESRQDPIVTGILNKSNRSNHLLHGGGGAGGSSSTIHHPGASHSSSSNSTTISSYAGKHSEYIRKKNFGGGGSGGGRSTYSPSSSSSYRILNNQNQTNNSKQ